MESRIYVNQGSEKRKPFLGKGTGTGRRRVIDLLRAALVLVLICLLISCSTLRTALDADHWLQDTDDIEIKPDKPIPLPPMAEDLDRPIAADPD
jgi:hypothetical protein